MELKPITIRLENLLLDPNNYRYRDLDGYSPVDEHRYHEPRVQERAYQYLRNVEAFGLPSLRDSIHQNGFIPLDRIVVRPYDPDNEKYVIVEGNRRIAAVRWLRENHEHGVVTLDPKVYDELDTIDALELVEDQEGNAARVIMAIRHVAGIREWGPYQQARLIVELIEAGVNVPTIAQQLGMETREVSRRYRASKALAQMEEDDDYGDYAAPQLYAAFQELISRPKVRSWLGWNAEEGQFDNDEARTQLYEWLSPSEGPDGESRPPKIRSWAQARTLQRIIQSDEAFSILADPERTYEDAYAAAHRESKSANALSELEYALKRASSAVQNLPATALAELEAVYLELMKEVTRAIERQLELRDKLIKE